MCENIGRGEDDAQIAKFPRQYNETTQDLLSDPPNYFCSGNRNFISQNFPMYSKYYCTKWLVS